MSLKEKALKNIVRKGKNAGNQHFLLLLPQNIFFPIKDNLYYFSNVCHLIRKCPKFNSVVRSSYQKTSMCNMLFHFSLIFNIMKRFYLLDFINEQNFLTIKIFNSLLNNKILDLSKLHVKSFASDKRNVNYKLKSLF